MSALDKMKNNIERMTGKTKEKVGEAVGNDRLKAEGKNDQAKGDLKDAGEKVKDAGTAVKESGVKIKDAIKH
jgi:uncharacterized protein YjbJ (UPF0337 family)